MYATEHYICRGGCEGVSDKPGVCQAKDCPKHGEPLEKCLCVDGEHDGAFAEENAFDEAEEEESE